MPIRRYSLLQPDVLSLLSLRCNIPAYYYLKRDMRVLSCSWPKQAGVSGRVMYIQGAEGFITEQHTYHFGQSMLPS